MQPNFEHCINPVKKKSFKNERKTLKVVWRIVFKLIRDPSANLRKRLHVTYFISMRNGFILRRMEQQQEKGRHA